MVFVNAKDNPPTLPAPITRAGYSEFAHSSKRRRDDLIPLLTPSFWNSTSIWQGITCYKSPELESHGGGCLVSYHVHLKIVLIISHCWHRLQTSNAIIPALDMSGSQPPHQRRRTRLSWSIWPHSRATLGAGGFPHGVLPCKVAAFSLGFIECISCWPTCPSGLTDLGAWFHHGCVVTLCSQTAQSRPCTAPKGVDLGKPNGLSKPSCSGL